MRFKHNVSISLKRALLGQSSLDQVCSYEIGIFKVSKSQNCILSATALERCPSSPCESLYFY